MTRGPGLRFEGLHLGYGRHCVIHALDAVIPAGSRFAIAGPNGSGKTTLMKAIAGLVRPAGGQIVVEGVDDAAPRIAYLPQAHAIERDFPTTLQHLVATGLWPSRGEAKAIGREDRQRVEAALEAVGLAGLGERALSALSAGQFQRAMFARVTLQEATLILLDEPFNAVDEATVERLLATIDSWHGEGRTVVCILHDAALVEARFDGCLRLSTPP